MALKNNRKKAFHIEVEQLDAMHTMKAIKYPTVCPIYLMKLPFINCSKKYTNVTKNPPILLHTLEYTRYQSPRSLAQELQLAQILQEFKIEKKKRRPF